ncbi:DUF4326 domain-containing protein [Streptomyces olivaceus]|uniref:DUF4326 domain-containing protein n=1 Tax=Streptomyces olivaceus TaxID=47716 RepID=UPI001CCF4BA0|nr:DUF4326 domain-containing protein [Streptomyces olivaceus]MBZ6250529.1 DUF4326 domain-containing protein [Streptomyces olivaceus]
MTQPLTEQQLADTQPRRIQRRRTRGWTLAGAADLYRGGMIVDRSSRYGNPCKVSLMQEMGYEDPHAAAAANYRTWLAGNRSDAPTDEGDQQRERILAGLERLRGKDLACPCPLDRACHADYLLRLANMPAVDLAVWVGQVRARVDRQRVRDGEQPLQPVPTP